MMRRARGAHTLPTPQSRGTHMAWHACTWPQCGTYLAHVLKKMAPSQCYGACAYFYQLGVGRSMPHRAQSERRMHVWFDVRCSWNDSVHVLRTLSCGCCAIDCCCLPLLLLLLLVDLCHHHLCRAFASTAVSRHALDSQFSASQALISLAVGNALVCSNVIHGLPFCFLVVD